MASRDKYRLLTQVGGGFYGPSLPECLSDKGPILGWAIEDEPRTAKEKLRAAFAAGAEFGDVCRAMLDSRPAFIAVVRAENVPRLVDAAREMGRELLIDPIPEEENPLGLYGRIKVGRLIEHAEGEGPAEKPGPPKAGPSRRA